MIHRSLTTILLATMAITSGCAGFKANNLPVVSATDLQSNVAVKTKIYSRWTLQSDSALMNDNVKVAAAAINKKMFDQVINQSGCCEIVESAKDADVVVDGVNINENNATALLPAFITGFSLYTIPSWVTSKVHITAQAKRGEISKSYDLQDSMKMVQWLPMIFVLPVKGNPIKMEQEVSENTYKTLVVKLKADGLIN